jgi:hypothetical protein
MVSIPVLLLNIEKMNEKYRIAASKDRMEVKLEPDEIAIDG